MPSRDEVLVSVAGRRAPRQGFDPITVPAPGRIILRPEGYGVVIEREGNDDA